MHSEPIRSEQRLAVTIVALILGPIFMIGPAALGLAIVMHAGLSIRSVPATIVLIAGSLFIAHHMLQNYHWVEFNGTSIRARRFWTRRLVEQRVDDLIEVRPLGAAVRNLTTAATDAILGRVRGWELRFKTGPSIGLVRYDMAKAEELVKAVQEAACCLHTGTDDVG